MMPGSIKEMSAFPEEDEVLLIPFELFQKKTNRGRGWLHYYTIYFCGWSSFDGRGREEGWRQYLNIDIAQDLADASDEIEDVESANGTDSLESGLMKRRRIWNSFLTYIMIPICKCLLFIFHSTSCFLNIYFILWNYVNLLHDLTNRREIKYVCIVLTSPKLLRS